MGRRLSKENLLHVEDKPFEVAAFGVEDLYRVVWGLLQGMHDPYAASGFDGGGNYGVVEQRLVDDL
jgi:hypothetical protein